MTPAEKPRESHVASSPPGGPGLLHFDPHSTHEATSPQALNGPKIAERTVG